jgi:lipopolysaccharide heptosyltransferase II
MTTVPHAPKAGNRAAIFAPNWLGDAVMALPAIADLRRALPEARMTIVARPAIAPLFGMVPGIDDVIEIDGRSDAQRALEVLKAQAFDSALLLPNSFHTALLAWRAGIPERWGYRAQCRSLLLTRAASRRRPLHQASSYQELVRDLGFPNGSTVPELNASAAIRERGRAVLSANGWDGRAPLVAVAPGAANGLAKRWMPASFAAVANSVASENAVPVLVGSAGDAEPGARLQEALDPIARARLVDVIGRTDLPALAGVLVHCRALVTNDSGGMHFAAAVGVPVVALFGPSNEEETRPIGRSRSVVLTNPVWCRPCMLEECPLDHRCMRGISPETVVAALRGM